MASFMDFVANTSNWIPGGAQAIPSWLTGMLVKKPQMNNDAINGLYANMVGQGAAANAFAGQNADFFNANYRPAAVAFNDRAQGVGGQADLAEAADRGAANFKGAFDTRKAAINREMTGINPNSGAAMARRSALDASYAPGVVDSMNKGRMEREKYGDSLRATALPFLATTPNFATGASLFGSAASGMNAQNALNYKMYRDEAGDTVKALKLPFDLQDEQARAKKRADTTSGGLSSVFDWFNKRGGNTGEDAAIAQFKLDAPNMFDVIDGS